MQRRHFQPRRREKVRKTPTTPVLMAEALVRAVSIRRRGPPGVLWQASTNTRVLRCELRRWQRDNPTEVALVRGVPPRVWQHEAAVQVVWVVLAAVTRLREKAAETHGHLETVW